MHGIAKVDYLSRLELLNLELLHVRSLNFFSLSQYQRTRGHIYKIYKQPCRLNVSLYSFANRVIEFWNSLPLEIVSASCVALFKRLLDTVDFTPYMLDKY